MMTVGWHRKSLPQSTSQNLLLYWVLIRALQEVQKWRRTILTLGSIVGRGCPSCRWQVCQSARGWWEGVCRVSAEETNNSKRTLAPPCQTLNWRAKDLSWIPWRNSRYGYTVYIWCIRCKNQFTSSTTSKCQCGTIQKVSKYRREGINYSKCLILWKGERWGLV